MMDWEQMDDDERYAIMFGAYLPQSHQATHRRVTRRPLLILASLLFLLVGLTAAFAQNVTRIGPITSGNCASFNSPNTIQDSGVICNGSPVGAAGGVLSGTYPNPGFAASPAGSFNYTNSANGTGVTRTLQTKLDDSLSVKDYGVKCDGSTDDTANIRIADAAAAVAAKALRFPGGTCIVSSAIVPAASAHWIGEGFGNTSLETNSATANILTISNVNITVENFQFLASVTRTAGWYVDVGSSQFWLNNFLMTAPFEGIRVQDAVSIIAIQNGTINNAVVTSGIGIRVGSGTAGGPTGVRILHVIVAAPSSSRPFSQLFIANAGDVTVVNSQFIEGIQNINISPGTGQTVGSVNVVESYADSAGTHDLLIGPSGSGVVQRLKFDGVWFATSASGNAVTIAPTNTSTVDGVSFVDCEAYNAGSGSGYSIAQGAGTTVKNISIIGGRVSGSVIGINIGSIANALISGVTIGANAGFAGNTNGIVIAGTITTLVLTGNNDLGNTINYANTATITNFVAVGNLPATINVYTSLTTATNSLGADVALNNTANYFDGPSMAQGTTGTWYASGTVTLIDTAGAAQVYCKLWDGTTVISSADFTLGAASFIGMISLSGVLASPAANIRMSCRDINSTSGKILFNTTSNSKDSTITGVRIN